MLIEKHISAPSTHAEAMILAMVGVGTYILSSVNALWF